MGETVKTEDRELIVRSLVHYSYRLKELQDHPDIKKGNSILKKDLEENAKKAAEISEESGYNYADLLNTQTGRIICFALSCYVEDLTSGQNKAKILLGRINVDFQGVQNEIKSAHKIKSKINCGGIKFTGELEKDTFSL